MMITNQHEASRPEPEDQLDEIVATYLSELDSGGQPDCHKLLDQYPGLRAELLAFFEDRDRLEQWARPFREAPSPRRHHGLLVCPGCLSDLEVGLDEAHCNSCNSRFHLEQDGATLLPINRRLGRYELRGRAGRGGFGSVYEGWDADLLRKVAIKVPRAGVLQDDEDLERFVREARHAAGLHHPNIVQVLDVGKVNGVPFLISEFVHGRTLASVISNSAISIPHIAGMVATLADALHYAHTNGVIHRDVKPSNIIIDTAGTPCLMDFGLALSAAAEQTITHDGRILGTPAYMSPEQASGNSHTVDGRTDVYSLGVVLYQLISGQEPFSGAGQFVVYQILHDEPRPPRQIRKSIPRDLETICLTCLQKSPAQRYATARSLADDLRRFQAGRPILARHITPLARLQKWTLRNPVLAGVAGLATLFLIATTITALAWGIHASRLAQSIERGLRTSEARRSENHLDRGLAEAERGDVALGLLWMARALETIPPGADHLESTIRKNIGAWEQCLVRLTSLAPYPKPGPFAFGKSTDMLWLTSEPNTHVGKFELTARRFSGQTLEHDSQVTALAVDAHETRLAAGTANGDLTVWDLATAKVHKRLSGSGRVAVLAISSDGQFVVVGRTRQQPDRKIYTFLQAWNIAANAPLGPIYKEPSEVRSVAISPEGATTLFVSRFRKTVDCLENSTGRVRQSILPHQGFVLAVAFSKDGKTILTGADDRTARIWDNRTGALHGVLYHREPVKFVAFVADNQSIVTASPDDGIRIWNGSAIPAPVASILHPAQVRVLATNPKRTLLASGCDDGLVRLWKPESTNRLVLVRQLKTGHPVASLVFSPDGEHLASTTHLGKSAVLWNTTTGELIARLPQRADVRTTAFSPDGTLLATACYDGTVTVWDSSTGLPMLPASFKHGKHVTAVAFAPNGRELLTACADGIARVWDVKTGELLRQTDQQDSQILSVAFGATGSLFLTGSMTGSARLWDAADCSLKRTLFEHAYGVYLVRSTPDGRRFLTGSLDHTARIWDANTGSSLGPPLRHAGPIRSSDIDSKGELIATTSKDQTARIWQAMTGRPLGPALPHNASVESSSLLEEHRCLATCGVDGMLRLWSLPPIRSQAVPEIIRSIQEQTGLVMDADGGVLPMEYAAWKSLRESAPRAAVAEPP